MATYFELLQAAETPDLNRRIRVACFIAAESARTELGTIPNHANRLAWAKRVFENPDQEARRMVWAVLAQNKDATLAQIQNATDAQVQIAVDAAVDVFAVAVA
jgi:hypothetical protein